MNSPTTAPTIPMSSTALVPSTEQSERRLQTQIFRESLTREFNLSSDDPTFILLRLFSFHEEFMLRLRDAIRGDQEAFALKFQGIIENAVDRQGEFAGGTETMIVHLEEERGKYLERARLDDSERARLTVLVEESIGGFKTYQQNLIDTNKLQINLEAACQVLSKRAMIESILNYLLPVMGVFLGAGGMLYLLLRFGWLVQSAQP